MASNHFAPLGCKVKAHVVPEINKTWAPHIASGYYIGNTMEHYHCHNIYIPDTKGTPVCSSIFFKPKYLTMPNLTPSDTLIKAADTLSEAITGAIPVSSITNDTITQLLNIFKQQANSTKDATSAHRVLTQRAQSQRVHTEQSNTFPHPDIPTQADKLWMDLIESQPEFQLLEIEEQIPEPEIQSEPLEYHKNWSTTNPPQPGTRANNTEFEPSLKIVLITSWKQKQQPVNKKRQHRNTR
jgi:hypothetical protein